MTQGTQERRMPRGAVEDTGPRMKYLHLKHNTICEESKTPVEGWIEKEIKDDHGRVTMTKWIKPLKGIEAWINEIIWYHREHDGKPYMGWKMILDAGDQLYSLDWPLNNRATKRMLMTILNINFQDFVEISAWADRETGNLAVNFKQNGQSIPQFYTKADMKDCPPPSQKMVMGQLKWDWEQTDNFLWQMMQDHVAPAVLRIAMDERNWRPLEQQRKDGSTGEMTHSGPAGAIEPDSAPSTPPTGPVRPAGHVVGCKCEPCVACDKANDDIPF